MSSFLRRLRCPHLPPPPPSLSLYYYYYILSPPFRSSLQCLHRLLLSTASAATGVPPPNSPFAIEYLIQSCGLPPDKALRASNYIPHLKSPHKPDAVLRFLRQTGISQSHITTAVSQDPRILCSNVDKTWKPNVAKLQEVGLSIEQISAVICHSPGAFRMNFVPKIDFWMGTLGSIENLSVVLKRFGYLLNSSLEKVLVPNLSFLQEQCGLSVPHIIRLIKSAPRAITSTPEALKVNVKRAEELGCKCSSPMFLHALITVCCLNQRTIDAKLSKLTSFGFSQREVTALISKFPHVLTLSDQKIRCKIEFLTKEVGCEKFHVIQNPVVLTLSLEKRLIPRSLVHKLLESKGFLVSNRSFFTSAKLNEKQFVEKMILPYEHAIPGLRQAYTDACSVKKFS